MIKRSIDIVVSLTILTLLAPIIALVAICVRQQLGSPVLFRQRRPGLHGISFEIIKFRTMSNAVNTDGELLPDADRLPAFGKWLRSTSLDELPQMINVLRGNMSLVGPRPLLEEYLLLYDARQRTRHDVRPGITGWAQVNGRNATAWADRLEMDAWYVENRSLWLDAKIMFLTLRKVVSRHGVAQEGAATVERFRGNEDSGSAKG